MRSILCQQPQRSVIGRSLVFLPVVLCALWFGQPAQGTAPSNPPVGEQAKSYQDHLHRLQAAVDALPTHRSAASNAAPHLLGDPAQRLARHLRLLENSLHTLGDDGPTLLAQLRELQRQIDDLTHETSTSRGSSESILPEITSPAALDATPPTAQGAAKTLPPNNDCVTARAIDLGTVAGSLAQGTRDGASSCDLNGTSRDIWFRYTPAVDGPIAAYLEDPSNPGIHLAVYEGCPGTELNEIDCGGARGVIADGAAGDDLFIRLAGGDGVDDVTFVLAAAGQISGHVLQRDGANPALPAEVQLYDSEGGFAGFTEVADDGTFGFTVAKPGDYFAEARSPLFQAELFDDLPCTACEPTLGTPIPVTAGAQIADIDFRLDDLGRISGTVIDASTGQPLASVNVAVTADGGSSKSAVTDAQGRYTVEGLLPGDYFAGVFEADYRDEVYDGVQCPPDNCTPAELGTAIPLGLNQHRRDIDFQLDPLGQIRGRITRGDTGQPLQFIGVIVVGQDGSQSTDFTDGQGNYVIGGLEPGTYRVTTSVFGEPYVDEVFDDLPCPYLDCDVTQGTPVIVGQEEIVGGIDFALERTGSIAGTVLETTDNRGISTAQVAAFDLQGTVVNSVFANVNGDFVIDGLAPGDYRLGASSNLHMDTVFGGDACGSIFIACDIASGTLIPVALAETTAGVVIAMDRLGQIAGRVTDLESGQPLPFSLVIAWDADGFVVATATAADDGTYVLPGLPSGSYTVSASSSGFRRDLFPGIAFPSCDAPCDTSSGTVFEVDVNQTIGDIDFRLRRQGTVAGTVRDAAGEPIDFLRVEVRALNGSLINSATTDAQGHYVVPSLGAGTYVVQTSAAMQGYIDQIYDGNPCDGPCLADDGTAVTLPEGGAAEGIDFTLDRLGVVRGTVRNGLWNEPRNDRPPIDFLDPQGNLAYRTFARFDGTFEMVGMAPGTYYAVADDSQLFQGVPCRFGNCDLTSGTALNVDRNVVVSDVDFVTELQQGLAGTVSDAATGLAIGNAQVKVYDGSGFVTSVLTSAGGHYQIPLALGTYFLQLDLGTTTYIGVEQIYDGIACGDPATCDPRAGTPVEVLDNQVRSDIDFALVGQFCTTTSESLCLNDGRFRVSMRYAESGGSTNPGGASRPGNALPLTDDSGTFYFFSPDNIEIVVKVIDACVDPFEHFWVFATGLTDLATLLTVTDTYTGTTKTYGTDFGMPFELIRDVTAFATCDVSGNAEASVPKTAPLETMPTNVPRLLAEIDDGTRRATANRAAFTPTGGTPPPIRGAAATAKTIGACQPSDTVLCVQQNRFRVEALWQAPDGNAGTARAVPLTSDTGYFWFFADDNVEVIVKALDACVDPWNSFWIFAAGLTDVEVTLHVTDTITGEVKQYVNPQGTAFRPIQDTSAFATCP